MVDRKGERSIRAPAVDRPMEISSESCREHSGIGGRIEISDDDESFSSLRLATQHLGEIIEIRFLFPERFRSERWVRMDGEDRETPEFETSYGVILAPEDLLPEQFLICEECDGFGLILVVEAPFEETLPGNGIEKWLIRFDQYGGIRLL